MRCVGTASIRSLSPRPSIAMYVVRISKRDLSARWALPDRVFFACGACHILADAFLRAYPRAGFVPIWIRPRPGYTGNHIVLVRRDIAFDYHGYGRWDALLAHMTRKARRWWPGWAADLVELPRVVIGCEPRSREIPGLRLRESRQFLHDAAPRADRFLARFPPPPTGASDPNQECLR